VLWLRRQLAKDTRPYRPDSGWWMFFLAVFFFFSLIGWLSALSSVKQTLTVGSACITAFLAGLIAVMYASVITLRWWWMLPIALLFHFVGSPWIWTRLADLNIVRVLPEGAAAGTARGAQMGLGIACVAVGQTLLVWFLNTTGKRAQRVRAEIEQAQRIHEAVVTPSHVRQDGLEVLARTFPSAQIGGDLVDVVERGGPGREGEVDIFVADVAGHGVGAGLVTGIVKSAIRTQLAQDPPPSLDALASRLNAVLCDLTRPEMFVTMACLRVRRNGPREPISTVDCLLAGHPPMLHWSARNRRCSWIENDSLPLGIEPVATFANVSVPIEPGDTIMLFTDGLNETIGKDGKQLGLEPLAQIFTRAATNPTSVQALHATILSAVRDFGPQNDDRSLVLVRIGPLETHRKPPII